MVSKNLLFDLNMPVIKFSFDRFVKINNYFEDWELFFYNRKIDKSELNVNDFLLTYFDNNVLSDYLQLNYKTKKFYISANNNLTKINVNIDGDNTIIIIDDKKRLMKLLYSFIYEAIDDFTKNCIFDWKKVMHFFKDKSGASSVYLYLKEDNKFKLVHSITKEKVTDKVYFLDKVSLLDSIDIFYEKTSEDSVIFTNGIDKNYKTIVLSIGSYSKLVGFCVLNFKERINYYIINIFSQMLNVFYLILYRLAKNRYLFDFSIFDMMETGALLIDKQKKVIDFNNKMLGYISELKRFQIIDSFFISDKQINIDDILSKKKISSHEQIEIDNVIINYISLSNDKFLFLVNNIKTDIIGDTNKLIEPVSILASGIAHRYNNIMTSIVANVNLLQEMLKSGNFDLENVFSILDKIINISLKTKSINQQLISFTKGGKPVRQYGNFRRFILNYIMELKKNITYINLFVEDDIPDIEFSKEQFNIVLENIIQNSIESLKNVLTPRIDVILRKSSKDDFERFNIPFLNYVTVIIKDNGIGFSSKDISNIFLPFFTRKQGHVGLGLSIVSKIIFNHNGYIFIDSNEGKGTCVYIFLPAGKLKDKIIKKKKEIKKILLMDDEKDIREVLKEGLTFLGYKVDVSTNFDETVRLFKEAKYSKKPYDLLILDLIIEGSLGGLETLREVKKIDKDIMAIAISGYSDNEVMSNCRDYGFVDVLLKPFNIMELQNRIEKLLK